MNYLDIGKTKAYEVMKIVKRFYNGSIPNLTECVKRDSVLDYLGTNIEHEIYIKNLLKKGGGKVETLQEGKV